MTYVWFNLMVLLREVQEFPACQSKGCTFFRSQRLNDILYIHGSVQGIIF